MVENPLFLPELIRVLMSGETNSQNVCKVVKVDPRGPHDEEPEVVVTNVISQGPMIGSSVPAYQECFLASWLNIQLGETKLIITDLTFIFVYKDPNVGIFVPNTP